MSDVYDASSRLTASWFFENARELFGVVSPEGLILEINPAWTALTGWMPEELLGRNLLSLLHTDSRGPVVEMGRKLTRDGDVPSRMQMRCADDRWVWLEGSARRGPQGEMMGMLRDVTEEYRRAEALQHASQVEKLLSQTAGVGLWRYDPRTEEILWSAEWTAMLAAAGISMKTPEEFVQVCHPDDYEHVLATITAAVEQGHAGAFNHRMRAADGRWIWVRAHVHAESAAEGVHVVHGISQDVTELAEARGDAEAQFQRLKIALQAANAAVVEIGYDEPFLWTSSGFDDLVGQSMTYAQARATVWPFVHPDDTTTVRTAVGSWLDGGPVEPLDARVLLPDGSERWVRIFSEIQKDVTGRWRRSIHLIKDVDQRKRQELALVEAEKAAQAATEAKSQFLANMSHELRTPMNGVLGVLHLLKGQALPSQARSMIDEALSCGGMLQALLDDIVDFSRLEAGRLALTSEPVDAHAVLGGVAAMLRQKAEEKGLALTLEMGALPPWIAGDALRLRQCLFNLIGNAVKFTREGSVAVRTMTRTALDGTRLRFEVEDTGIGISAEVQAVLFERFQQADTSTTRRFGGSGLGLAITRKLVEMMGGEVGVISASGQGATFWFELPVEEIEPPVPEEAAEAAVLDGCRVLVVEDNPTNRMIATKMLESFGAIASMAEDGEQGVEAALGGDFDLILMDIQMPRLDGMEATRRIRASASSAASTPIIALTANVLAHQCESYLAAGMDGVVGKPISPARLLREISRLVETPPPTGEHQIAHIVAL
ncbi:ATP-binding protein [Phenylobacterium sp.]|uniref:ATP-binding protein n=1 Tax=Phenylobacterium sp. TaxID=1871053 RepID=UPI002FC621E7